VAGLLALMLLTDARRAARAGPDGRLIPLDEQDRTTWDRDRITEGVALISTALPHGQPGPYQVQAAIAAVHDEADSVETTDWREVLGLYDVLAQLAPGPVVSLNRAVAIAMVSGPAAGLEELRDLEASGPLAGHHRLYSTRAHLLERAGDLAAARAAYQEAAGRTASLPERQYLTARAAALAGQQENSAGM
jgi:predicted RNA polymerase sigma factor